MDLNTAYFLGLMMTGFVTLWVCYVAWAFRGDS